MPITFERDDAGYLEPVLKEVESDESVVIRYVVLGVDGGTTCGRRRAERAMTDRRCGIRVI